MTNDILSDKSIAECLSSHGLRVTPQRISVYRFLKENPIHPSADTVYRHIVKKYPSFSRTTVYNSLNALVESGLVITVKLDDKEQRYDGNAEFHGHFRCDVCGNIYDFKPHSLSYEGLDGFLVTNQDVYFTGVCAHCQEHLKQKQ